MKCAKYFGKKDLVDWLASAHDPRLIIRKNGLVELYDAEVDEIDMSDVEEDSSVEFQQLILLAVLDAMEFLFGMDAIRYRKQLADWLMTELVMAATEGELWRMTLG
jgi:hypothetical protein